MEKSRPVTRDETPAPATRVYEVISGDGHLETPPEDWTPWIPSAFRDKAPKTVRNDSGIECISIEGIPLTPIGPEATCGDDPKVLKRNENSFYEEDRQTRRVGLGDAVQRLHEQDMDGIDAEVLFPPLIISNLLRKIPDNKAYLAMIQAYNTWLAEKYCATAPDRLIGLGVVPIINVDEAIAEMKRCKKLGLRGVNLKQWPSGEGHYSQSDDKFFSALLEEDMSLAPHIFFGKPLPSFAAVATQALEGHAENKASISILEAPENPDRKYYAFRIPNRTASNIVELIANRVFDRFPELKIYFGESKATWVHDWLEDSADTLASRRHWYGIEISKGVDEYVRRHVILNFIRGSQEVHQCHLWDGEDNLTWGSDCPHNASTFPFSREWIDRAFDGESEEVRRKILVGNVAKYFRLDTERNLTPTPPGGPYHHPRLEQNVPFRKDERGRYVSIL
jgi:uncharacterized protein